jgi:exonuclease SbcD
MIRFIHTADLHFGVENYGVLDPVTGISTRLLDFARSFDFLVQYAINHKVDFVVIAGDIYKNATPTPTQQRLFLKSVMQLYHAHIPVVMVVGNHDHAASFGKAHALDLFHHLPCDGFFIMHKPMILPLKTASGMVNIVGLPWPNRSLATLQGQDVGQYLGQIVATLHDQLDDNPAILVAHVAVSTGLYSGSERRVLGSSDPVLLPSQLALPKFWYGALGHLHRYQTVNATMVRDMAGTVPLVYAGSIERIDFGERNEQKGFVLVSMAENKSVTYEHIATPARALVQINCTVHVNESVTKRLLQEITRHDIADAIIKIVYTVPSCMKDRIDMAAIMQACSSAHYIAGIIPIWQESMTKTARMNMSMGMSWDMTIRQYFKKHDEYHVHEERLFAKTMALYQQLFSETDTNTESDVHVHQIPAE